MPTVRKGSRQVSTMALPGVRLTAAETPESRGAGLAIAQGRTTEAIGELAGTVGSLAFREYSRIQQEERQKADDVALLAAKNKKDAWQLQRLYDPQTGALRLKGSDSFTLPEEVDQDLAKINSEIEQGFGNTRQKAAWERMKSQDDNNVRMTIARHVASQREAFDAAEFEGGIKNKHSLAIANALDPARMAQELADGEKMIDQRGDRLGLGTQAIADQKAAFRSDIHIGVIDNLLASPGHTAEAQHYFAETRDQIAVDQLDDVTKKLSVGTTRKQSQEQTARILAEGGTLAEQRAKAKQIDDPDVQDEVLSRIEHEDDIRRFNEQQAERDNLNTAYNIVTQTHDVDRIPPGLLTKLGTHQPALRSYADSLSRGEPPTTDMGTLYDLLTLSSANPEQFLRTNLLGYMDKVGKEDLEQLMRMQGSIRNGTPKSTDGIFISERAQNEIVDEALTKAGLVGSPTELRNPKNKALSDRIIGFRQSVREAVNRQQQITGKHVTDEDMQGIVDRLVAPGGSRVSSRGYFYDSYEPVFVFETDDARKAAASIPPRYLPQIDAALRRTGLPVDDAHRIELYQRSLNRGGD